MSVPVTINSTFQICQPSEFIPKSRRPNGYFDQLKNLYTSELHTSVLSFSGWILSLCASKPEIMTESQNCQVLIFCGDSATKLMDFFRAETYYKKALQMYKYLIKSSPQIKAKLAEDCGSVNDLKFKLHLCLVQCKRTAEALKVLQTISVKQRTVQVNMALGKLFQESGMERAAVGCYKEVLKACPMAVDAAEELLHLGASEEDVQAIIGERVLKYMPYSDWYKSWIHGTSAVVRKNHLNGINTFKQIREKYGLFHCTPLLHSIGVAHANYGDYPSAVAALRTAHQAEPTNMRGMDLLAFLFWKQDMGHDLYKLMSRLNEFNYHEMRSEPWTATAYYALKSKRLSQALVFSHRASNYAGIRVPEGLVAKGQVFIAMKKYQEALECFREAMAVDGGRFEPHQGVVECYLSLQRGRDAMAVALGATKAIGHTPRVYTLCADTLKKDPVTVPKARAYLEKALAIDNTYLPAILNLVELYEADGKFNDAIQVLTNQIEARVNPAKLHVKLAGLFVRNNMEDNASEQYAIALRLDPTNKEAREAIQRLDPSAGRVRDTYAMSEDVISMELDEDDEDEVGSLYDG